MIMLTFVDDESCMHACLFYSSSSFEKDWKLLELKSIIYLYAHFSVLMYNSKDCNSEVCNCCDRVAHKHTLQLASACTLLISLYIPCGALGFPPIALVLLHQTRVLKLCFCTASTTWLTMVVILLSRNFLTWCFSCLCNFSRNFGFSWDALCCSVACGGESAV